jgi:integrase/recombinase XerD
MNSLRQAAEDYLRIRRALGFKLENAGRLLPQFLDYLESVGAETITTEHAVRWATLPSAANPVWWGLRLTVVRGFARYLQTIDPTAELPPLGVLPAAAGGRRPTPYIYSQADIVALLAAAARWRPRLGGLTLQTLIGLLAVTGMRTGEAIRLDRNDLDLAHGVLTVRKTKFGKSRELPVHPSTVKALREYARVRDRLCPEPTTRAVLVSQAGTRLLYCAVHATFKQLRDHAGLRPRSVSCRPRIYDFRHRFAVRTLLDWCRSGVDVQPLMPSTYLGHTRPSDSYWYLTAAPELLELAAERLQHTEGRPS